MPLVFNIAGNTYQHYAIKELEVLADCICNGQQTGCELNNDTMEYNCICGGNTKGQFCESCQPLFNQQPFKYGVPCDTCNCNQHASECFYDKGVAALKQSTDGNGTKNGGGVCVNCLHHTTGVNCEKCSTNYFRPIDKQQTEEAACVPCECSMSGSTVNPVSSIVADCIMNNDNSLEAGQAPGDCFCKKNVEGTKCTQCKKEYFNLRADNSDGCQPCDCEVGGTIGSNKTCENDSTGQCNCKQNVQNRQCDECKDGFYNLNPNNAEGCTACGCDPGGSQSMTCDKTFGKCPCRTNIDAMKCDSPSDLHYYPDVHFISAEFEYGTGDASLSRGPQYGGFKGDGYADLKSGNLVGVNLAIPGGTQLTGEYILIIRYTTTIASTGQLEVKSLGTSPLMINFPVCSSGWCSVNTLASRNFTLQPAVYTVTIRVLGDMFLDQIVAVPVEFVNPLSSLVDPSFSTVCNVLENSIGTDDAVQKLCKASIFSMTTYYLNGARSCDCDKDGSMSMECEVYSGTCRCKPGVGGRKCDECLPGFYDLSNTGCKACECKGSNSVCDKGTGQCVCPPNTIGRICDTCAVYHWNWSSAGCQPCGCDVTGSISAGCDQKTGVCTCKLGVEGEKCTQCKDEFKLFSVSGCSSCLCSTVGSNSTVCAKTTGQCICKENVAGMICDQCSATSFYLDKANDAGCLDCVCMGITQSCSSSTQRLSRTSTLLTTNLGGKLQASIQLSDGQGALVNNTINIISGDTMYLSVTQEGTTPQYWMAPGDLKGNLLHLYGMNIDTDIQYTSTGSGTASPAQAIMVGRKGRYVHDFGAPGADNKTQLSVKVDEKSWLKDGTTALNRSDFILAISSVDYILLPASFLNGPHTSQLHRLVYYKKESTGSVNLMMENCQCGTGYIGSSCEECAPGYRRDKVGEKGYLGVCVPCECNNHATECNPDTGDCINCQHQTTGSKCEMCKAGYYGDATLGTPSDCNECMCYPPRVVNSTCEQESGSIKCLFCETGYVGNLCDECDTFYYGNPNILNTGKCTRCNCNGNSDSCDKNTGKCIDCKSQTVGDHCERCQDGFFGNATSQSCANCACSPGGSSSSVCDTSTGQCPCYTGVGTRQCSKCKTGFWGYSDRRSFGSYSKNFSLFLPCPFNLQCCVPCNCIEAGSTTLQCNDADGKCTCKPNVQGDKCDTCEDGYFGLPTQPCEVNLLSVDRKYSKKLSCFPCKMDTKRFDEGPAACNCNVTGTVTGQMTCNKTSGQCDCKSGVSGRQCNECMKFYSGFSEAGCTACGECEQSLGNDTLKQIERYAELWSGTQKVSGIQEQDMVLRNLQSELNMTLGNLGLGGGSSQTSVTANLSSLTTSSNTEIDKLMSQVTRLEKGTEQYKNDCTAANNKIVVMVTKSNMVLSNASAVKQKSSNYDLTLTTWDTTATQILNQGSSDGSGISLDFSAEKQKADAVLAKIKDVTRVGSMDTKVSQQSGLIDNIKTQSSTVETDIQSGAKSVLDKEQELVALLAKETDIRTKQTTARRYKTNTEENVLEAGKLISKADNETKTAQTDLDSGKAAVLKHDAIYNGVAMTAVADDLKPLPTGYDNFVNGAAELNRTLGPAETARDAEVQTVAAAEITARSLMNAAELLNQTFLEVKGRGDNAVDAINSYEKVTPLLNDALNLSGNANKTIEETRTMMAGISVMNLETLANTAKLASEQMRTEFTSLNYGTEVLKSRIESANASLVETVNDWNKVETLINQMTASANQLKTTSEANTVNQVVSEGDVAVSQAEELLTRLTATSDAHVSNLNTRESQINTLKDLSATGNQLITNTEQSLTTHNTNIDTMNRQIEHVNGLKTETQTLKESLESKVTSIKAKIATALSKLKTLKQPIHFNGSSPISVTNPITTSDQNYNDISLEFRKESGVTNGLIFFTENTNSGAELSLELVAGKVTFDYNTNLDPVTIENPAVICDGCWAKIIASRYGNSGHLTVKVLSTGGLATMAGRGKSSSQNLLVNSPLMFGGLPSTYQTTKVRTRNFLGCVQKADFNGNDVNLWQEAIDLNWEPKCCRQPLQTKPDNLSPGVSIDGSGYLLLSQSTLNLAARSSLYLTIKFRTFNPNAAILLVISSDKLTKYTLFLQDGNVNFEYGTSANMFTAKSQKKYNTGEWVQVIAQFTANQFELETKIDGVTSPTPDKIIKGALPVSLVGLDSQDIIIGVNKNPNDVDYSRSEKNFAGCLKELKFGSGVDSLTELSLSSNPIKSLGVSTSGCYNTILNGMRFTSLTSTAELNVGAATLAALQQIEFTLITSEPKSILLYIQEAVSATRKLYISLFHGNIIVIYQENNQQIFEVMTTGLYLSDGQQHNIKLQILQPKAKLTVGNSVLESSQDLVASPLSFTNTPTLHVGGVPGTITLPASFPARTSLIGSIRELKVNSVLLDPFAAGVIVKEDGLDLSGVATPSGFIPPPPFTTTTPPVTIPPPSCATVTVPSYLEASAGVWFTGADNENLNYDRTNIPANMFRTSFMIFITFQSFSPNGILYYMANQNTNQNEYFMVYLRDGYIHTKFKGKLEATGEVIEYDFKSDLRYNDGVKYQVDILRLNNFLALVEKTRKDYANNAIETTQASTLDINTNVYIGGINQAVGRAILPITENVNFVGAVYNVELKMDPVSYTFDLRNATGQEATGLIYKSAVYGVSLTGVNSYIKLENPLNGNELSFTLGYRSIQTTVNLLTIYETSGKFVVLDLLNGKIRVLLASSTSGGQSFISVSEQQINVCDNERHNITVAIGQLGVGIQLDTFINQVFPYPMGLNPPSLRNRPVYIGGLEDTSLVFPDPVSKESLRGCVERFVLQGVEYDLTQQIKSSSGLTYACPV
ncbi:hypothetical protein LOTGIDRAFT_164938 [Lottia gigantea]|uniref:Laminin EGF-like domain-containing protein n=1 Tax=Lottia gigantea TaxID=225164 RepID=V3ZEQ7_LOTGI|nr:hypothetical protein LOTGIDRAFT_164938 [Lottia gigantea]ESO89633.1 hypothetical protein LOTGIDRAFT_164938 [Lottia gigantea]